MLGVAYAWVWRYHSPHPHEIDEERWVEEAWYISNWDDCWFEGVETADGVMHTYDEIRKMPEYRAFEERSMEQVRNAPPPEARLEVQHPKGEWCVVSSGTLERMQEEFERSTFPAERRRILITAKSSRSAWM